MTRPARARRSAGATSTCASRWRPPPACRCRSRTPGRACALAQAWALRSDGGGLGGDLVFVSVSDGLGVGVIINGEVLRGRHNIAGEFGHVPLSLDGPRCSCGSNGCWEAYVSNRATLARYFGRPSPAMPARCDAPARTSRSKISSPGPASATPRPSAALEATARYLGLGTGVGRQRARSRARLHRRRDHAGLGPHRRHRARGARRAHAHAGGGRHRDPAGRGQRVPAPAGRRGARRRAGLCRAGRGLVAVHSEETPVSIDASHPLARHLHRARHRTARKGRTHARRAGHRRLALPALRPRDPRRRRCAGAPSRPASYESGAHLPGRQPPTVAAGRQRHTLNRYDALYVPRDAHGRRSRPVPAAATSPRSPRRSTGVHAVQVVRFADIRQDPDAARRGRRPDRRSATSTCSSARTCEAGRIMAGVTFSEPGNWTSWPPHEHAAMLEEAYLYIDMPAPAFGVQLVYTDAARARGRDHRPRRRRGAHAAGLPPERRGAWRRRSTSCG